jgi:type VI secretion system protein VasG
VRVTVDGQLVGEVISGWTGIPAGKMMKDEITTALNLEQHLNARVIGQGHGIHQISQRIRTARAVAPCSRLGCAARLGGCVALGRRRRCAL